MAAFLSGLHRNPASRDWSSKMGSPFDVRRKLSSLSRFPLGKWLSTCAAHFAGRVSKIEQTKKYLIAILL
jgi:hypothetical protein